MGIQQKYLRGVWEACPSEYFRFPQLGPEAISQLALRKNTIHEANSLTMGGEGIGQSVLLYRHAFTLCMFNFREFLVDL